MTDQELHIARNVAAGLGCKVCDVTDLNQSRRHDLDYLLYCTLRPGEDLQSAVDDMKAGYNADRPARVTCPIEHGFVNVNILEGPAPFLPLSAMLRGLHDQALWTHSIIISWIPTIDRREEN